LSAHIKSGRLHKSDFGWSIPAAIKPMLEQHSGATDTCPAPRQAERAS
jgi:hypothetical protein